MFSFENETWVLTVLPPLLQVAGLVYILRGLQGCWRWWQQRFEIHNNCPLVQLARRMLLPGSLLAIVTGTHLVVDNRSAWLSLTVLVLVQLLYLRRRAGLQAQPLPAHPVPPSVSQQTLPLALGLWLMSLLVAVGH